MAPYDSVWGDIETGWSPMAPDHFWTPPDPKMAHTNSKDTKLIKILKLQLFVCPCCYYEEETAVPGVVPSPYIPIAQTMRGSLSQTLSHGGTKKP